MNELKVQFGEISFLSITPVYGAIFALILVVLSLRVIALRGNPLFAFFKFGADEEGKMLKRAIRGQGNFIEYTPIFLILLTFAELQGLGAVWIHLFALVFLAGRLMHGFGFAFTHHNVVLRVGGIGLTLFALIILALVLLFI